MSGRGDTADLFADPFREHEHTSLLVRPEVVLLGGSFRFESNSRRLLRLVDEAYRDLPAHRLSAVVPRFRVKLVAMPDAASRGVRTHAQPPPLAMLSGPGLLAGATERSDFVAVSPDLRAALVGVSAPMMRFRYHTRYEMIEFAVFTLAARAQGLAPLHAACVGHAGRGLLLMGHSGSGKSTVALQCLLSGLDFVSEDSAFVAPDTLLTTGVANYLHVRKDSLRWVSRTAAAAIRRSPVIQRRSGARKFEVDLRRGDYRLAAGPLKLAAVVFLSDRSARGPGLLTPLSRRDLLQRLSREQPYAAGLPQWEPFRRNLAQLGGFDLRRGRHPIESVEALRTLLDAAAARANSSSMASGRKREV